MRRYSVIWKLIKEAWKVDKIYFLFLLCNVVFQSLITIIAMYIPATIVDMLNANNSIKNILIVIATYLISLYVMKEIQMWSQTVFSNLNINMNKRLEARLSEKSMSMVYKNLEDPSSLDLIQRAKTPIGWGYISYTFNTLNTILLSSFTIFGLISILILYSPIYTLIIIMILIVSTLFRFSFQKKFDSLVQQNIPMNRKSNYFFENTYSPTFQKEFRIFNLSEMMNKRQRQHDKVIINWAKQMILQEAYMGNSESIASALITFVALSYNSIRLLGNSLGEKITIGKFTLIYNATNTIMEHVLKISENISIINSAATNLHPWKEFLEISDENNNGNLACEEINSLEFRNVSFKYPNSDVLILDNISFKINKGEKISIVGLNNAGKSTIIKLICRFYKLDKGEILWNNININEYEKEPYFEQISAVFQDFKLFPYTIYENIMPHEDDKEKALQSLKKVNMHDEVMKLDKKMDTYLSKDLEKDATNFSIGQNQKLAIARAVNKGGSLIILDEPTSALDPIAESEIFENFYKLTQNKTSIFISHRMSSSRFSDKILLLNNGKIEDFDSHNNLMSKDNLYKELFETQAQNYR